MTLISRLGFIPVRKQTISSEKLEATKDVSIVIPVKNNQSGIDFFLSEFFKAHHSASFPKEILIVDNNSNPPLQLNERQYPIPVRLFLCGEPGPACARNVGVKNSTTQWILFTDSDCIPTHSLISGYLVCQNGSVGYAGNVKAYGNDTLSKYYEEQEILMPPKVAEPEGKNSPDYLITANCLVWKPAFELVGGFNESIKIAGGEDIDLGFKLRSVGHLTYAFESIARHNFTGGLASFRERFIRYGFGNKLIGKLYGLHLQPKPFIPNQKRPLYFLLAFSQFFWLRLGYNLDTYKT